MTENLYNEEQLRDFLLGDLTESERAVIEELFLADEDFSDQVHVVEDELIESYLRRELSAGDQQRFEAAFLTQPRRRERVLAMKAVLAAVSAETGVKHAEAPSRWTRVMSLFRFQHAFVSYALAAVILIALSFGMWLLFSRFQESQSPQMAQQNGGVNQAASPVASSPLPSPRSSQSSPAPSPTVTPVLRASPSPTPETVAGPTFATIILRPTLLRDPGTANKLIVTPSVKQVHLQLKLERNDYKAYAIRITTVDGHMVWQRASAKPANGGRSLSVVLPARILTTDDYLIELSGVDDGGPRERLADYFFTVARASRP